VLNRNRRLLLWWSQQKKDVVNDVNLQYLTMANPAMARRGGMAGLPPPPDPPLRNTNNHLRDLNIPCCTVRPCTMSATALFSGA